MIGPVTALMVDQGRIDPGSDARWLEPDAGAAFRFGQLLEEAGLTVKNRALPVDAAREFDEADIVGEVRSAPMGDLVERMLRDSDNQLAESLGRLAADGAGKPPSFSGAVRGHPVGRRSAWGRSGWLRHLRRQRAVARRRAAAPVACRGAACAPAPNLELASILSGLAVAGFDGTLADRFVIGEAREGAGVVRAKTGTLTGISAEAGVVTTCDGGLVAYAFVADEVVDTEAARAALDDAAALLATCDSAR